MAKIHTRELVILLVLAVMWSSSFTVIKVAVEVIPPTTLAALRIAFAAVILWAWMRFRGGKLEFKPRLWWMFFLIGIFGNAFPFVMINWGEMEISSGLAATLISLMPLSALVLGHYFSDEVLNARRVLGIVMGLMGVIVLIGPQSLLELGDDVFRQLAVAGGAVCYAIAGILVRKLPETKPVEHGAGILIAATVVMLPASMLADQPWTLNYTFETLAAAMYLGIFPTALATIFLIEIIAARGVTFLSLNNYLIPALGVLWGVLFLGETVTSGAIGGLALILVGIAVAGIGPATVQEEIEQQQDAEAEYRDQA